MVRNTQPSIAVDIGVAKYQLSQREEGKYVILDEPIQSEKYGIGFKKGNDELKDTVWEEVLLLPSDAEEGGYHWTSCVHLLQFLQEYWQHVYLPYGNRSVRIPDSIP